jgi:replication fork protection complex subunit Tof1/Swi1
MSSPSSQTQTYTEAEAEAAETLRHQLIYNGQVLDIALDSLRSYTEGGVGGRSLTYLHASVGLAWALFRMLERWGKGSGAGGGRGGGEEMYVRKKKARRRKRKGVGEGGEGVPDVEEDVGEEEEEEEVVLETMFTFEAFEMVCPFPSLPPFLPYPRCPEIRKLRNNKNPPGLSSPVQRVRFFVLR